MKKIFTFMIALGMMLLVVSCGAPSEESQENSEIIEDTNIEETVVEESAAEDNIVHEAVTPETDPVLEYFESDAIVNDFFVNYNKIASNVIDVGAIEEGNIRTKALVYADNFNLEVINTNNGTLSISIGTKPEEEDTSMFAVFTDCLKAMSSLSDDEISNAWNAIHETGYMVEDFELSSILITYVPSKELSWGVNDPRVDLTIPIE